MNENTCAKCAKPLVLVDINGTFHSACDCNIVKDVKPKSHFGKFNVTKDGCRWQYGKDDATIIDFTTFEPRHVHHFFEKNAADPYRYQLHKANAKAHAKHYAKEYQFDLPYGWREPEKKGLYKGKPGFIVTSGPSLKKNAHLLVDLPGPVLACNSALKVIPERPDWYMYGDFLADFTKWYPNGEKPMKPKAGILLYGGANQSILEYDWGRHVYFNMNNSGNQTNSCTGIVNHYMPDAFRLINGYAMFYSAIHLAYLWGCNPIVLLGADHSWSTEYHGGMGDKDAPQKQAFHHETMDVFGTLVMTSKELQTVQAYIEVESTFLACAGVALLNATEGGTMYHRCQGVPLEQFLKEYREGWTFSSAGSLRMTKEGQGIAMTEMMRHKQGETPEPTRIPKELVYGPGGSRGPGYEQKDILGIDEINGDNKKKSEKEKVVEVK